MDETKPAETMSGVADDSQNDESGKAEFYEVERILDEKLSETGELFYKVRWAGYSSEDDTFEPASALEQCKEILAEWEIRKSRAIQRNAA